MAQLISSYRQRAFVMAHPKTQTKDPNDHEVLALVVTEHQDVLEVDKTPTSKPHISFSVID